MSTIFDNDILIHHIAAPGLPGDGFTAPEATAIRNDLDTMLARPVISSLDTIPDVDASSPANGQALVFNQTSGNWEADNVTGAIEGVYTRNAGAWDPIATPARRMYFRDGVRASVGGSDPTYAVIEADLAGTGTSTSVARSDHTHTQPLPTRVTTAPSGYMSGGSRSLGSTSVTLANGIAYVVEAELSGQLRGADSGAGYYTLSITIDGNTFTSPGGSGGFWCVQGVPREAAWKHERKITGTGASVAVSASVAYHSGAGFNVDRTYLKVRLRPDR